MQDDHSRVKFVPSLANLQSSYQRIKKQVGISSSMCQTMNLLGCPCEATYGWLLQDKSRLHSDLFMSTLVVDLIRMKFLSIRSTGLG